MQIRGQDKLGSRANNQKYVRFIKSVIVVQFTLYSIADYYHKTHTDVSFHLVYYMSPVFPN